MKKILAGITLTIFGLIGGSGIAYADEECLLIPEKAGVIKHKAVTHQEFRWKRDIPAKEAVEHEEYRFKRQNPGSYEVSHQEYRFTRVEPAVDGVSHFEYQFNRENPGVQEVSHNEWRMVIHNPGKDEVSHQEFKYRKTIPAIDGEKEFEYKKKVTDYKTEWLYRKQVKGDVLKKCKRDSSWVKSGTFDWEWWSGNSTQWSDKDVAVLENGNHNAVQDEWSEGSGQNKCDFKKQTTKYQYVKTGDTRQIENGFHWDYQWATSKPTGYTATGNWRWKIEPQPEKTVYYNDGNWTKNVLNAPWVKFDEKKVVDSAAVAPYDEWATETGRTTNVDEAAYFTAEEVATFSRGWEKYGDAKKVVTTEYVAPYTEYRAQDGSATVHEDDAGWFLEDAFENWTQFNKNEVEDSPAIPEKVFFKVLNGETQVETEADWFKEDYFYGWVQFGNSRTVIDQEAVLQFDEFLAQDGSVTLLESEAGQFKEKSFPGWEIFETVIVRDSEMVPAYTEYYVSGGEPTLELGDSNWTTDIPEGWILVDERTVTDKAAWSEKKVTPAKYGECLAYTGTDPLIPLGIGASAFALGFMTIGFLRRRKVTV